MPISIQRPSGPNVAVANSRATVYFSDGTFTADENTDESIRLFYDPSDGFLVVRKRASGVWNDSSFRSSSGSLMVGRDLKIEAAADFIKTNNPSGFDIHSTALIPHIPFSDTGTGFPHTPITDVTADVVIFSTAVSEISGTTIGQTFTITSSQIIKLITYEVGTVGATSNIQHTIYRGTDNTGDILSRMNFPASDFPAETSVPIDFGSAFGFSDMHADIFVEFITDTSFTLKTDVSGDILITLNSQQLETRDLLYDDLIFTESLGLVLTSDLNPIYTNQF